MSTREVLSAATAGVRRGDLLVGALVATVGQQEVWLPAPGFSEMVGPRPVVGLVYVVTSLALLWRRRAPLTVLTVVCVVLAADYLVLGSPEGLGTFLPPLLAFYAVGRYAVTWRFGVGLVVVAAHLVVHETRDPAFTFDGPAVILWAVLFGAGFLGVTLRARHAEARAAAEREQRLVAAERARLARELHDIVGHGLSLVVPHLVAVDGQVENGDLAAARRRLTMLEDAARQTLAETRRLVEVMGPDEEAALGPQPGLPDVPALVQEVSRAGARVELSVSGGTVAVSSGLGLTVYRLVQEALTNVVRHAQPPVARVLLEIGPKVLTVEVTDEGTVRAEGVRAGNGLRGMRRRVVLYGGSFDAGPQPGGGFRVRAAFPLSESLL
jgi:signal transduction histidine kinase